MARKSLIFGGLTLALALVFAPAAQAAVQNPQDLDLRNERLCVTNFEEAAKAGLNLDLVHDYTRRIGESCAGNIGSSAVPNLIRNIRTVVTNTVKAAKQGGSAERGGEVIATALNAAGQPSVVAVDPSLYSMILTESSTFTELALDENVETDLGKILNLARNPPGSQPGYNQQPTVSIEQK